MYQPPTLLGGHVLMYIESQNAASHDSTNRVRFPEVTAHLAGEDTLRELGSQGDHIVQLADEDRLAELAEELGYDELVEAAHDAGVGLEEAGLRPIDVVGAPTLGLEDYGVDDEEARITFDEEGRARVRAEIGELLADAYDHIEIVERESSGTTDTDAGTGGED